MPGLRLRTIFPAALALLAVLAVSIPARGQSQAVEPPPAPAAAPPAPLVPEQLARAVAPAVGSALVGQTTAPTPPGPIVVIHRWEGPAGPVAPTPSAGPVTPSGQAPAPAALASPQAAVATPQTVTTTTTTTTTPQRVRRPGPIRQGLALLGDGLVLTGCRLQHARDTVVVTRIPSSPAPVVSTTSAMSATVTTTHQATVLGQYAPVAAPAPAPAPPAKALPAPQAPGK